MKTEREKLLYGERVVYGSELHRETQIPQVMLEIDYLRREGLEMYLKHGNGD